MRACVCVCLRVCCLFVCLFVCLLVCLFACLLVCLFVLFVRLCVLFSCAEDNAPCITMLLLQRPKGRSRGILESVHQVCQGHGDAARNTCLATMIEVVGQEQMGDRDAVELETWMWCEDGGFHGRQKRQSICLLWQYQ